MPWWRRLAPRSHSCRMQKQEPHGEEPRATRRLEPWKQARLYPSFETAAARPPQDEVGVSALAPPHGEEPERSEGVSNPHGEEPERSEGVSNHGHRRVHPSRRPLRGPPQDE